MKIEFESNLIRHFLKNVYFINGTAYAGKSTMVALLAEKYKMIRCGENYHNNIASEIAIPEKQPGLCYFRTMSGWSEFLNRTPEDYAEWIERTSREAAQIEILELIRISQSNKVIVDTNIPIEILHEISDYNHVAIMLSPQAMSVEQFFERDDEDKKFLLDQISKCENPEKTLANFKSCMEKTNSREIYDAFANSGFFTLVRQNTNEDTRTEVLDLLEKHFLLSDI
jgi:cytidylate kinase